MCGMLCGRKAAGTPIKARFEGAPGGRRACLLFDLGSQIFAANILGCPYKLHLMDNLKDA